MFANQNDATESRIQKFELLQM